LACRRCVTGRLSLHYKNIPYDPSGRDRQLDGVGAEGATYSGISQAKGPLGEGPLESRCAYAGALHRRGKSVVAGDTLRFRDRDGWRS